MEGSEVIVYNFINQVFCIFLNYWIFSLFMKQLDKDAGLEESKVAFR